MYSKRESKLYQLGIRSFYKDYHLSHSLPLKCNNITSCKTVTFSLNIEGQNCISLIGYYFFHHIRSHLYVLIILLILQTGNAWALALMLRLYEPARSINNRFTRFLIFRSWNTKRVVKKYDNFQIQSPTWYIALNMHVHVPASYSSVRTTASCPGMLTSLSAQRVRSGLSGSLDLPQNGFLILKR